MKMEKKKKQIGSLWKTTTCLLDLFFKEENVRKGEKEVEQVKAEAVREKKFVALIYV